MMITLLIFGYLITIGWTVSYVFKKKIEEAIAPAVFFCIFTMYLCGLVFKDLRVGVCVCLFYGVAGVVFFFFILFKKKNEFLKTLPSEVFTNGFFLFAILFVIVYYINRGRMFDHWDEFSHWGLVLKNMVIFNRLGNYEYSTVVFKGYPPGMALWEYFIIKLYRDFSFEQYAYMALGWLVISLIVPIASKFKRSSFFGAALVTLMLFLLPGIFYEDYIASLYVDPILGILFAYLLFITFEMDYCESYGYIVMTLGMTILCLVKASGAFLAVTAGVAMMCGALQDEEKEKNRKTNMIVASALCLVFALLGGKGTWSRYLKTTDTAPAWNMKQITVGGLIKLMQGDGEEYQYQTIKNFCNAVFDRDFCSYLINMRFIHWVLLSIAVFTVLYYLRKNCRKRILVHGAILFWGGTVYTIGLLILYLFTYSEYEALRLAAFNRYLSTYITAVLYFVIYMFGRICSNDEVSNNPVYIEVGLLCAFSVFFQGSRMKCLGVQNRESIVNAQMNRLVYEEAIHPWQQVLDYKKDKFAVISQRDNGNDKWRIYYLMTPIKEWDYFGYWSLGEPYDDSDVWTVNITPEEWIDLLIREETHYVFVFNIDDRFIKDYGECFKGEPEMHMMYRLTVEGDSRVLVPLR